LLASEGSNEKSISKFLNDTYFSKELREWIEKNVRFIEIK